MTEEDKLENPVWHSLSETHQNFSIDNGTVKFYQPDYAPFGGAAAGTYSQEILSAYALQADNFFMVGGKPFYPDTLTLKNELICNQMVCREVIKTTGTEDIVLLDATQVQALVHLVNQVQPGYFKANTTQLGNYYGIFKNGVLVAAAGERMKMNHFTEVSAVVTHPGYTGKGYAKQLVAHVVNHVFKENKTPYLHVAENNTGAINLYHKLGFETRRKISFWKLGK